MVFTCQKRQLNGRILSQSDDFHQDITVGNTMTVRQGNDTVNECTVDQEFTVRNSAGNLANEIFVTVKILEKYFNEKINGEMGNIVDTIEDRIQNAFLTTIDSNNTPIIELANTSIKAFSGQDATSVMMSLEGGERIRKTASLENISEKNNTLHVFNTNDQTRNEIPYEVSELPVLGIHSGRQPHAHHRI